MGRIRPAWYYQRQAQEAQARENYYTNRQYQANQGAVRQRPETVTRFYRSMTQFDGSEHKVFQVTLSQPSHEAAGGDSGLGLLTTAPTGLTIQSLRGTRIKPSTVKWYRGTGTPTRKTTAWNTQYIKYYSDSDGPGGSQSHYQAPISKATGSFNAQDIQSAFRAMFEGSAGEGRLGTENGSARLELERAPITATT
jgi:hypothetical protein